MIMLVLVAVALFRLLVLVSLLESRGSFWLNVNLAKLLELERLKRFLIGTFGIFAVESLFYEADWVSK